MAIEGTCRYREETRRWHIYDHDGRWLASFGNEKDARRALATGKMAGAMSVNHGLSDRLVRYEKE